MDEASSHVRLDPPSLDGKADPKIAPPRSRIPYWKGLCAESEEKHEPVSDIDTGVVDSLKALDPKRPIREADIADDPTRLSFRVGPRKVEVTSVGGLYLMSTYGGSEVRDLRAR